MARYEHFVLTPTDDFGSFFSSRYKNLSPSQISISHDGTGSFVALVRVN